MKTILNGIICRMVFVLSVSLCCIGQTYADNWEILDLRNFQNDDKFTVNSDVEQFTLSKDSSDIGKYRLTYRLSDATAHAYLEILRQNICFTVKGLPSFQTVFPDGLTYPNGRKEVHTASTSDDQDYRDSDRFKVIHRYVGCDFSQWELNRDHPSSDTPYSSCHFQIWFSLQFRRLTTGQCKGKTDDEIIAMVSKLPDNTEKHKKTRSIKEKIGNHYYIKRLPDRGKNIFWFDTSRVYERKYYDQSLGQWREDRKSSEVVYFMLWHPTKPTTDLWFCTTLSLHYSAEHNGPIGGQAQKYLDESTALWDKVTTTLEKEFREIQLIESAGEPIIADKYRDEYGNLLTKAKDKEEEEEKTEANDSLPLKRTEDHAAKEDSGSDSYVIPVVIGGVLLGGAEWLRRVLKKRKKKGNKNDNENQNENEEENEEEEMPDVLEMEIHKDFGDTLVAGDVPQRISACIVRHPKNGAEYVDRKLTSQIEIFADDSYMAVHVEIGTMNGWKTALIQAPAWEAPPEEGVVQFRIASPEVSYTNRIHFKIQKGGIVFGQDNLTLPARYQKEVRLPILIKGMDMETTQVKVQVSGKEREDSMDYYPEMKWDEATGLWNVSLLDVWQNEEENAEHLPGDFLTYYIDVEATSDTGFVQKGRLPLYRFYMGLAFQLDGNDVGCYLEEYDPVHHIDSKRVVKMDGKEYTPAETRCSLRYFGYDEKTHKLIVMNPVVSTKPEDFQVKALVEGQQQMIDNLGLQLVIRSFSNGAPSYRLRCSKGVLNAPNRLYAIIEAKSHIGDVELTFKRVVVLQSQPKPSFKSPMELVEWQKENNAIRKKLEGIDRDIYAAGLGDRLAPLVQYIRLQIEAYNRDGHYGFDRRNVKKIYQTYNSIMVGEQGAAYEHPLVACDHLEEVVWEYFKCMRTTINDMGTFQKIFASVATLGLFDVAVGVVEVVGEMKDYVDKGGDSTFGMFYVGVKYVTKKYLMEKAMAVAASGVKNYWKSRGDFKTAWQQTKLDVKDLVTKEINSVKEFGKKFSAAEEAKARNAQANQKADELVNEAKKMPPKPDADYTDEAVKFGRKRAQKNLKELQDAIDRAKANPIEANIIKRNEMILQCQKDKQTMMMLKGQKNLETIEAANMGVNFGECRKELNNFFDKAYKATDNRMAYRLSEKVPGLKPSDVKIMNATSSAKNKLLSGKSVTFDRDVTYYYVDKATGKVKYFSQELTEKMYSQEFYEVTKASATLGYVPVKQAASTVKGFAKQMDQTIVEDVLGHSESYGKDLGKMIDKALQGDKLSDPTKVAEAVLYKGKERFYAAEKLLKQAKEAGANKLDLQATAIGEMVEGCRQQVKVFDLLDARDIARIGVNGQSKIPSSLRDSIGVLRKLSVDGSIDITQAQNALSVMGTNIDDVMYEMYRTVIEIG